MSDASSEEVEQVTDEPRPHRSVFLVPAALTLGNIFLGYLAIVKAFSGEFFFAAVLVLICGVTDKLDGMVARATKTTSDFGRELDSLADVISFGVAPALTAFIWGLRPLGAAGWGVAFFFLMCGALRLARFNVQASADRRFFVGLPIPMAASLPMTTILLIEQFGRAREPVAHPVAAWGFAVLVAATGFLMVSNFRYFSFKEVRFARSRRHHAMLAIGGAIIAIAVFRGPALFVLSLGYAAHGPLLRVAAWSAARRRQGSTADPEREEADAAAGEEPSAGSREASS